MIQNENAGSKKIKENKYKILRMSLLLGTDSNKEETINNFEDAARDIDSMNNETYLEELENKFYDTKTLEEESKKLTALTDYVAGRISQRESLISDYINVTGRNLNGLGEIKYESKLPEYQERLKYINQYLENSSKIEEETEELEKLRQELEEAEKLKKENEAKNSELEDLLLKKFAEIVSEKLDISKLDDESINENLEVLEPQIEESKKSLDIFTKSFETLKNAGISYEDEIEYKSYVSGAKDVYYEFKEEEYLLKLYKILLTNETEYSKIYIKRENITDLLNERIELRSNLIIKEDDVLENIYNLLNSQSKIVDGQKENIDNISMLISKIKHIEETIESLKLDNQKVEILSILKEYDIIETYEEENNIDIPIEDEIEEAVIEEKIDDVDLDIDTSFEFEETEDEPQEEMEETTEKEEDLEIELPINKPYKNNFVMGSHDPYALNVEECITKATNVMKRVGKMLNIEVKEEEVKLPVEEVTVKSEIPTEQPTIEQKVDPQIEETIENKIEEVSPFVAPSKEIKEKHFEEDIKEESSKEESNVKNVLPSAESFWNDTPIDENNENNLIPDLTVSNDDFFANNLDDFEFPNLDEFK